jgi:hypothetical protein
MFRQLFLVSELSRVRLSGAEVVGLRPVVGEHTTQFVNVNVISTQRRKIGKGKPEGSWFPGGGVFETGRSELTNKSLPLMLVEPH